MFKRPPLSFIKDPIWIKVASLAIILFFIFLADAVLSFWVPTFFEGIYKNTTKVGLIMSFSSVIGLLADLVLPQMVKGITVKKLVLLSIMSSFAFSLTLLWNSWTPLLITLLISMTIWGLYYEFLGFAQQQFVADSTPIRFHPAAWGIIGVFKSSAYFLGPIIAENYLVRDEKAPLYIALVFALISFVILSTYQKTHDRPLDIEVEKVNLFRELDHWKALFVHVWPILTMSVIMGIVDAAFWTVGPIITEELSRESWIGSMFVSFYVLPSLFMGFVVAKWGIYKGKKKWAEKFLLLSGLLFTLLGLVNSVYWIIFIVLIGSIANSSAYPLIDGVYSDIIARMGRERKHMIGLSNSTFSIAYIVGPPFAGLVANIVGEKTTFVVLGIITAIISIILLNKTPKKLFLPQEEIHKWKD